MDIQLLKSQTDIFLIARQLGITIGKGDKALCPFHNDKTPSLQFSKEKQICTCFSSNCNAGTMDVLDLIMKKMNWTLPETLQWLSLQNGVLPKEATKKEEKGNEKERIEILSQVYKQFTKGYHASKRAHEYLTGRGLDSRAVRCGFNTGQLHRAQMPKLGYL